MITHIVKPEEAPAMYKMMVEGSEKFLGVVFDWRK